MTGATSGFGVEWVKALALTKQFDVYVLARDQKKYKKLLTQLPVSVQNLLHFVKCELDDFESINQAVNELGSKLSCVDLLINNAGVFQNKMPQFSKNGIELTFAVNHLAPFILTHSLLPLLKSAKIANIVNTASFQHRKGTLNWDDIEYKNSSFNPMRSYQQSKLCNVIFTIELARQLKEENINVNCFDPGIVDTEMTKTSLPTFLKAIYPLLKKLIIRSPKKGAETGIFLSLIEDDQRISGHYFHDKKVKPAKKIAYSKDIAEKLWVYTSKYLTN